MAESKTVTDLKIFDEIAGSTINTLESRAWRVEGNEGNPVYRSDDSANLVYLLHTGRVRLYFSTSEDRRITLDFLEPGELFGELALVDFETRGEGAVTLEPSVMTVIPGSHFRSVMKSDLELFERVFDYMNARRLRIQNRLKTLAYEDARKRLIYVLLDRARRMGVKFVSNEPRPVQETHQELADMSGLARPTVTKILTELKNDDLIESRDNGIFLNNPLEMKSELTLPNDE